MADVQQNRERNVNILGLSKLLAVAMAVGTIPNSLQAQAPGYNFFAFKLKDCNNGGNGSAQCMHVIGVPPLHNGTVNFVFRATSNDGANYGIAGGLPWAIMPMTCTATSPMTGTCQGQFVTGFRTSLSAPVSFVINQGQLSVTINGGRHSYEKPIGDPLTLKDIHDITTVAPPRVSQNELGRPRSGRPA
jgi:hypothetical protein